MEVLPIPQLMIILETALMPKPKVFVTRMIPQAGLDRLTESVDLEVWPDELPPSYETLRARVQGIEGLLCMLSDRIDRPLLESAGGSLRVVSQYAVGFDNVDVAAATALGIAVGNTPGVLTEATADFAWALLMAAARRVVEADRLTRAGGWKTWGPQFLLGPEVFGATLGIVGFGRIGQAVARRGRGFNMRILYSGRNPYEQAGRELGAERVPFERLLAEADFISIHTSLNDETYHLFGPAQFEKMKTTAILVNTSRGAVIDQTALFKALQARRIAYAAIDVAEKEPIPLDDPLLSLDNLVIAPHIASAGIQTRTKMALIAADNLLAGLRHEKLLYCVNPEIYG
jgi:glyoxylate reductase